MLRIFYRYGVPFSVYACLPFLKYLNYPASIYIRWKHGNFIHIVSKISPPAGIRGARGKRNTHAFSSLESSPFIIETIRTERIRNKARREKERKSEEST